MSAGAQKEGFAISGDLECRIQFQYNVTPNALQYLTQSGKNALATTVADFTTMDRNLESLVTLKR